MKYKTALTASAALLALGAYWGISEETGPLSSRASSLPKAATGMSSNESRADVGRLSQELTRLRGELANLGTRVAMNTAPVKPIAEMDVPEHHDARTDVPTGESPLPAIGTTESLDERFAREARDPIWAASTAETLQNVLAAWDLAGLEVLNVDCHTSVCRVRLELLDSDSETEFQDELITHVLGTFSSIVMEREPLEGGDVGMVVHLASPHDSLAKELAAWKNTEHRDSADVHER
jgi:hypothetical protein